MKTLFKLLFYTISIALVSIICILGIVYIDQNNLIETLLEKTPMQAAALVPESFKEARMSFAMPHDTRPLVVDISEKNSKNKEYQYIYPSQIFYVSTHEIKLLFRDSVFTVDNNLGLKKLKERLQSSHGAAFLYTENYAINRAAINGVLRSERSSYKKYDYTYWVLLLNDDKLRIGRDVYKKMTENIELAKPDYSF